MSIATLLRPTPGAGSAIENSASARLAPARGTGKVTATAADATASAPTAATSASAPLRGRSTSVDGALQTQVARAQQAVDYLDRVAGQLDALKGELTARLTSARSGAQSGALSAAQSGARQQLDARIAQLTTLLQARRQSAGGSVDANLDYSDKPAVQRFRIRGLDIANLQQDAPQSLAFSVGGAGGPQLAVTLQANASSDEIAATLDRALAPMGVRASLGGQGELVFSTPESNWPAVKDSIAISGHGKVSTDALPASPAPQKWDTGTTDNLRQSLREVVQALERVRRSQAAASAALSDATVQVSESRTPPPQVELAAQDFASAATSTNYESLLALSSALVGVSRERVLALLGLQ